MREIKFRAWDSEVLVMLPNVQNHIGPVESAFGGMLKNDRFNIMEFTGLKDKNDVDIYEGDICQKYGDKFTNTGEVVMFHGCWMTLKDNECYFNLHHYQSEVKVIGNIHQHPELLKGE